MPLQPVITYTSFTSSEQAFLAALADLAWANGDIYYYNNGPKRLAKGTDTQVLTLSGGLPAWGSAAGSGTVTTVGSVDGSITVTNATSTPDLSVVKAPKLSTARTIGGVSFDGTANITVATATGGFTVTGGALALNDATTPSLTLASGSTNTGNITINGKTSGSFKITTADATAQAITLTVAAQTVGAATLTIPNMANTNKTIAWLESPSFTTPTLGVATATTINKVTLTQPATGSTLTIADGKTLTANNSITVAGTDGKTLTLTTGLTVTTNDGTLAFGAASKTLTVSDSTTLATNSITLAGGEVITFSATNALSLLTSGSTSMTFPAATDTVVCLATTQTMSNKHLTAQVQSVADAGGTFTPVSITNDYGIMTGLSQATTIAAPSGSPTQGDRLIIRIKDNGTARALTWNAIFRASSDLALPTTTIISKTMYCGFIYNSTDSKWDFVAFLNNF